MRRMCIVRAGALGLAAAVSGMVACGGDGGGPSNKRSAGSDAATEQNTGARDEAGNGQADSGGDGDGGGSGGSTYFVEVTALYLGAHVHSLYGVTGTASDRIAAGACAGTKSGVCCYTPYAAGGASAPEAGIMPSAGDITVMGSGGMLTLVPPYAGGDLPWTPGEALAVSAAGADIPAFSGSLQTPSTLAGVTPDLNTLVTIDHAKSFAVSWTPASDANAVVELTLVGSAGGAYVGTVTCDARDSAGTIVVDSSLTGYFSAGDQMTLSLLRAITATGASGNADTYLTGSWQAAAVGSFQ